MHKLTRNMMRYNFQIGLFTVNLTALAIREGSYTLRTALICSSVTVPHFSIMPGM